MESEPSPPEGSPTECIWMAPDTFAGCGHVVVEFPASALFATVFKRREDPSIGPDACRIASRDINARFGSDWSIDSVRVRSVDVPTLKELCLLVPPSVYQVLGNVRGESLVHLLWKERGNDGVWRPGDNVWLINGKVLHCEDWEHGIVDLSTRVVVVRDATEPSFKAIDPPIVTGSAKMGFTLQTLTSTMITQSTAPDYMSHFPREDPNAFACVHFSDLDELGCFSGDVVELVGEYSMFVRIFPFIDPCIYPSGSVYVSLQICAEMGPTAKVFRYSRGSITTGPLPIPLALDVTLARVAGRVTLDRRFQHALMLGLKYHFESHNRVVRLGDVIPIALDESLALVAGDAPSLPKGKPSVLAYFQVTAGMAKGEDGQSVEFVPGRQYFVSYSRSRMVQKGVVSDLVIGNLLPFANEIASHAGLDPPFNYSRDFDCAEQIRKIMNTAFDKGGTVATSVALTSTTRSVGKQSILRSLAFEMGATLLEFDCHELETKFPSQPGSLVAFVIGKCERVLEACAKVVVFFRHLDSLCKVADEGSSEQRTVDETISQKMTDTISRLMERGAIVVCSCIDADALNHVIRARFLFEVEIGVPNDIQRQAIYKWLLKDQNLRNDVSFSALSMQSAALTPCDITSIVKSVQIEARERFRKGSEKLGIPTRDLSLGSHVLIPDDFYNCINAARAKFSDAIGAPRIPNVTWDDVGGLDVVKGEILDTIDMPLKHPELFGPGMKKRSGILFYGPPGTGKTLLAKAIATNFSLNFFSVKGPELLNMYIGESEANVRRVFQKARDAAPCVVFFDELDSVAPKRGNQGDAGGVMDRIVSQLLAELDNLPNGVFVVGASNRPDLLDEALLRPGRFDKMLYLGISTTHPQQARILEALSRKFPLGPDVNLEAIAERCSFTFTGADLYALCSDALLGAMSRTARSVAAEVLKLGPGATPRTYFAQARAESYAVQVFQNDFEVALKNLRPSVSAGELSHYEKVRDSFKGK